MTNAVARGVVFVTATHNDGTGTIRFPGSITNCITVGATDQSDNRCPFSNYGPQIDLVAPGTNIYTVQMNGGLGLWWGTSFSTPLVAGVSALLVGLRPELTPEQIRTLLCAGADDLVGATGDTPGFDYYYGWGRLNAWNSILLARTRIDTVQVTKTRLVLSWISPTNAVTRQPYQVAGATALGGPWTPLTNTGSFGYVSGRTYWTNAIAASNGPVNFYKVGLPSLVP